MSRPSLRRLATVFAAFAVLSGIGDTHAEEVLRIGFQKSSTLLILIRSQGTSERELARQGIRVSWYEFPSGLSLLESLSVGNINLSADVADTVLVLIQAAGARPTYFARETSSSAAQAILVGEHSPLEPLAELEGERIAAAKATGNHYLLITVLISVGLEFSDIQPAYLTPVDGRAALENGKIDAWVTWDLYVASAQHQQHVRVLADGQGLASHQRCYPASSDYARKHPEVFQQVFAELQRTGRWFKSHPASTAKVLGPLWGNLGAATVEQANVRRNYDVQLASADGLDEQQHIADALHVQGLLPKLVDMRVVEVWQPRY